MDPITTALVAAITAGVTSGVKKICGQSVVDAYKGLKKLIQKKFGDKCGLSTAIKQLESKPDSDGRKKVLEEEVEESQANRDDVIISAAKNLLDKLKEQPNGEKHIQIAKGSYIAQADRGATATVSVNQPKKA